MSRNMRPEVWIGPNRRGLLPGILLCAFSVVLGLALILGFFGADSLWLRGIGGGLLLGSLGMIALAVSLISKPRVGYADRHLLLYLRMGAPLRIPIDIVEAFFLGTGPSMLPGARAGSRKTANVVIRIADRAADAHARDVTAALGVWSDGYITIRGTWCEPINAELLETLNARLTDINRRADLVQEAQ